MELLNNTLVVVSLGALIGFIIGWLARSGAAAKSKEMSQTLQQNKDEMAEYRKDVTAHFEKTAMLVGAMTEQYRAVYDHLADGAQSLCNDPTARLDAIGQGEALIAAHTASDEGQNAKPVTAADEVAGEEAEREPTAVSSVDNTDTDTTEEVPPAAGKAQSVPENPAS